MTGTKFSGIASIGDIPAHWKTYRIKSLLSLRSEKNSGDRDLLSVYLDRGVISYNDSDGMQVHKPSADLSNYQNVHTGDFVLNNQQAWRGSVGVSKYDGIISPAYFVFSLSDKCDPDYMNFLLRDGSMVQQYETASRGVGTIQRNLYALWFYESLVALPPLAEQRRIADFLDTKCSEIDSLTADIQAQIDTLEQYKRSIITETVTRGLNPDAEMKDSGVFYMAPMNASWRLTKIGYICTKLSRSFVSDDTALICSNKGKVQVRSDDLTGIMVSDDNAMQGIHAGDIAIHGMDTWHGAIALSEFDGKITRVVHVCDSTEDKRFIVYYMQHLAFQGVYKLISNGVRGNTSDFRSWDKVRDIWIAIPKTRQEQKAICDYLDRKCNDIEEIISTKKQQLAVLEEYKKSLIFEYVTGKKEVI
ncbi:putative type I site-specific restriction-modification system S subunit [Eubacterium sp. CAG:786]|nr:putative type I site-specific restriction-modification system S subunit [Eubacterium sp. CAG:786]